MSFPVFCSNRRVGGTGEDAGYYRRFAPPLRPGLFCPHKCHFLIGFALLAVIQTAIHIRMFGLKLRLIIRKRLFHAKERKGSWIPKPSFRGLRGFA